MVLVCTCVCVSPTFSDSLLVLFWFICFLFCLFVFYRKKEGVELESWMGGEVGRIWEEMREGKLLLEYIV